MHEKKRGGRDEKVFKRDARRGDETIRFSIIKQIQNRREA